MLLLPPVFCALCFFSLPSAARVAASLWWHPATDLCPVPCSIFSQIGGSGFILLACDGVWDEMSSSEAVAIAGQLLADHPDPGADIAGMFIEATLQKSMAR